MEPNSKKDLKFDKVLRKRETLKLYNYEALDCVVYDKNKPTKNNAIQVKHLDPQNQQCIQQQRSKKAKEQWQDLDKMYFKSIKQKNILVTRDLTSAQKLINFFSSQFELQGSFQNQQINQYSPQLEQKNLIHVLFKSSTPFFIQLVSFSFVNYIQNLSRRVNKNIKEQNAQTNLPLECRIVSKISNMDRDKQTVRIEQQQIEQAIKNGNLQFSSNILEQKLLFKVEKSQQIKQKVKFQQEIDIQLQLWQNQVDKQNSQNSILWNNLLSSYSKEELIQKNEFSTQVILIKESLMHHTILRYFQHGTRDKTHEMIKKLLESMKLIKPTKTRDSSNNKFFQTDCKTCFCSFNYDSNQVLYCDMCNTSFHLACYGLHQIPDEKQYFCDCCAAIKKQEKLKKTNIKKITCQICCKANFPIKQIDGHFYHMTCLVIFNFITIKDGRIQLREGLNHQTIIKKVIQSQTECQSCIYCVGSQGAETGMQLKCSYQGCQSSMHPICSYIHGCLFSVGKNMKEKKIDVNIPCNKHDYERDYIQQSYLRRYMCNFKNTSQKSLQLFRAQYQAEIQSRKLKLESRGNGLGFLPKLIADTKVIRRYIVQRQQKLLDKTQVMESTESRKMLEKLVRKNF